MKTEELLVVSLAAFAVFLILKSGSKSTSSRGLSSGLQKQVDTFGAAGGQLWTDTEAAYSGTWTSNGPLDLSNYGKQIYD